MRWTVVSRDIAETHGMHALHSVCLGLVNEHVVQGVWAHTSDTSDPRGVCQSLNHSERV